MRWLDGITDSMVMSSGSKFPRVRDGQGSLVCCGGKELDTTERLN